MILLAIEMNDIATMPLMTLFPTTPIADACDRNRNGKISVLKTQHIGPIPIEKNPTFPHTNTTTDSIPMELLLRSENVIQFVLMSLSDCAHVQQWLSPDFRKLKKLNWDEVMNLKQIMRKKLKSRQ